MWNSMYSRNMHPSDSASGYGSDVQKSPLPGSGSIAVRDLDDVRDALHGGFRSPKLDDRGGHGSIRTASLATGAAIIVGLGLLALLGWLSNQPINRQEVPQTVLTNMTCGAVPGGFQFRAQLDPRAASDVAVLDDAAGLEVRVTLVDQASLVNGGEITTETVWMDFADGEAVVVDFGQIAPVTPECVVNVFAA